MKDSDRPERRGPAPRKGGPGILPVVALLALLSGAAYVAVLADKGKQAQTDGDEEEAETGYQPFANVPPETIPEPRPRRDSDPYDDKPPAPAGLDQDPVWRQALVIAERGWTLTDEAAAARMADEQERYREKAKEAQAAFDEAFTMTAEWEVELLEKYGDRDRQVREIVRTRNKWIDKVRLFHKTAPTGG